MRSVSRLSRSIQVGDWCCHLQAGIMVLPVKLDPQDCHLAIWNKSPDSWYHWCLNCSESISPYRRTSDTKPKTNFQRPWGVLRFLQPVLPKEKIKSVYGICAKWGQGFWTFSLVHEPRKLKRPWHKKSDSPWQQNCHARNIPSQLTQASISKIYQVRKRD